MICPEVTSFSTRDHASYLRRGKRGRLLTGSTASAGVVTMYPTQAQGRVLSVLDGARGQWVPMRWLDTTPLLHEDDFPVVPSLIENGWAQHRLRAVQITESGLTALKAARRATRENR
jgi:hypothetical protein